MEEIERRLLESLCSHFSYTNIASLLGISYSHVRNMFVHKNDEIPGAFKQAILREWEKLNISPTTLSALSHTWKIPIPRKQRTTFDLCNSVDTVVISSLLNIPSENFTDFELIPSQKSYWPKGCDYMIMPENTTISLNVQFEYVPLLDLHIINNGHRRLTLRYRREAISNTENFQLYRTLFCAIKVLAQIQLIQQEVALECFFHDKEELRFFEELRGNGSLKRILENQYIVSLYPNNP